MVRNTNDSHDSITYNYKFIFGDGTEREFTVCLDGETLNLRDIKHKSPPEWAELSNCKCPNCPLQSREYFYCPVALNIADLIEFFKDSISYEEVDVVVESDARNYTKHTSLQKGVSALLGLYMVTSGCPVLGKLKPMVRYHLPFATMEETSFRAISTYLLAQYFNRTKGKRTDWDLKNLSKMYDEIQKVNRSFWKRLSNIKIQDASINALIILDNFANYVTYKIDENCLSDIELLCEAYFD